MQDIRLLPTLKDRREFITQLWRTPEFKSLSQNNLFIKDLLERFCEFPRLTFVPTDPIIERGNFTSWYNALALRDSYVNPTINDLYYLHEIAHIATMPYSKETDFSPWCTKIFQNELEASVISEAYIYVLSPSLRKKSFDHEIWVDRFLPGILKQDLLVALDFLITERDRAQHLPGSNDQQELRIHAYQKQNEDWAELWRKDYVEVENHMVEFYEVAASHPEKAIVEHGQWLQQKIQAGGKSYPFPEEVEKFAAILSGTPKVTTPPLGA